MLKNLGIRSKMFGILAILVVVVLAVASLGIFQLGAMNERMIQAVDITAPKMRAAVDIRYLRASIARTARDMILEDSEEGIAKRIGQIQKYYGDMSQRLKDLRALADPEEAKLCDAIAGQFQGLEEITREAVPLMQRNTTNQALSLSQNECRAAFNAARNALIQVIAINEDGGNMHSRAVSAEKILENLNQVFLAQKNMLLDRSPEIQQTYQAERDTAAATLEKQFAELQASATERDKGAVAESMIAWERFRELDRKAREFALDNSNHRAFQVIANRCGDNANATDKTLDDLLAKTDVESQRDKALSEKAYAVAWWTSLGVGGIGILLSVGLGALVIRGVVGGLQIVVDGLKSGGGQIDNASRQVAESSQRLAEGTSEQASALEETSASLEEMSAMTVQNAENTRLASQSVTETRDAAENGVVAVQRMSTAIDEIKSSADKTSVIIKTIDEIAFQTNLLALNAAVEAARAGDAGRGFAVVAEEVRSLAKRSAEAAKSTASLIEESSRSAENGVLAAKDVAEVLEAIRQGVQRVSQLILEVSNASQQQADGIGQVNKAVSEMDRITQSNASNSEETAAAAEELSSQAGELNEMVQRLTEIMSGRNSTAGESAAPRATPSATFQEKRRADIRVGATREAVTSNGRFHRRMPVAAGNGVATLPAEVGDIKDF